MPSPLSRVIRTYEKSFNRNPSLTLAITNSCLKCLGDFLAQLLPCLASGEPFVLDFHRSLRFLLFGFLHGPCIGKWHEFLEKRVPLTPNQTGGLVPKRGVVNEDQQALEMIQTDNFRSIHHSNTKNHTGGSGGGLSRPLSIRSRSIHETPSTFKLFSDTSDTQLLGVNYVASRKSRSLRFWGIIKRVLLDQLIMAPLYALVFITMTGWFEGLSIPEIQERLNRLYWYILTANWKIWPLIQIINFNFMPLKYRVPWQGCCGILWTVFLSLSTHSSSPLSLATTAAAAAGVSKIFENQKFDQIKQHLPSAQALGNLSTRFFEKLTPPSQVQDQISTPSESIRTKIRVNS
ncbi:hypothetical protein O181_072551 [Austropuccinia psidii MF-1]|uniref:Uncharacterized protein n=1 Tax=Austropuccinia psidii MF-1 TaxID=1389203 RepID=A0A9Q3F9F7_9BASI|nr:hypothetical protein [Austropuccinia psidii MF-1]